MPCQTLKRTTNCLYIIPSWNFAFLSQAIYKETVHCRHFLVCDQEMVSSSFVYISVYLLVSHSRWLTVETLSPGILQANAENDVEAAGKASAEEQEDSRQEASVDQKELKVSRCVYLHKNKGILLC